MTETTRSIDRLVAIMAALRTPGTGCPWDLEQDFASIAPYTIEEAFEVADAIERGDLDDLRDELGDLLLQVVFHARMAEEQDVFDFEDVAEAICRKLVRRHPHVFGDARDLAPEDVKRLWEEIKREERAERADRRGARAVRHSALDGVPAGLPGLTRAVKLTSKAAKVGFDWDDAGQVLAKVREEVEEVEHALDHGGATELKDEVGDLLFAVANLARHAGIDPEAALRGANQKFVRRFEAIEAGLAEHGRQPAQASLAEMEALWVKAKQRERE